MSGARVLAVVEDTDLRLLIRRSLSPQGFDVTVAEGGRRAPAVAEHRLPDVVLLDFDLDSALNICRGLRSWSAVPIIGLSSTGDQCAKVQALESGADDYITKPVGVEELSARIRVALRHAAGTSLRPEVLLGDGDLRVDFRTRQVWRGDREIPLTPREYDVLKFLVQHRDRDLRYWEVLRAVWGGDAGHDSRSRRRYIPRLRNKLEADPSRPRYLLSHPGSGCRFRS